jgi:hypothetical protein
LSSNQLSKALKKIESTRELAALIGIETDLQFLTDDDVIWVIEQWRRLHPKRTRKSPDIDRVYSGMQLLEEMQERSVLYARVIEAINERLDCSKLADLEVMFYRERDCIPTEYYGQMVAETLQTHDAINDSKSVIRHLIEKTNFLQNMRGSAKRLGRLALAAKLKDF